MLFRNVVRWISTLQNYERVGRAVGHLLDDDEEAKLGREVVD